MQKILALPFSLAVVAACADSPATGNGQIELRSSGSGPVTGSAFQCTGTWPSAWTPCDYPWSSKPVTSAIGDDGALVDLSLHRSPIPVDGGATVVVLALQFGVDGPINASAQASTSRAGTVNPITTSAAISGWVDPVDMGHTAEVRNAGRFSLTFSWGTISGTYDTASAP
jgi:hypothetical protein